MLLTDFSIKKPITAVVINLILVIFGIVFFDRLSLREYPDVNPPVISITTTYIGASAKVMENKVSRIIEEQVSGIEGIKYISSTSSDGVSSVNIEFKASRKIEDALNDVRDKISNADRELPAEADKSTVRKANADDQPMLWMNLDNDNKSLLEITDYAKNYVADKFSNLDGVARVFIGGGQEQSMRIWIDYSKLFANDLTSEDIANALRRENLEVPAGTIESKNRDFTITIERGFRTAEDFDNLIIKRGNDGHHLKLKDIARVEVGPLEYRNSLRGNGKPMVGIGIVKQSTSNTLTIARSVKSKMAELNQKLGDGYSLGINYDSSIFVEKSIIEVYKSLIIALLLVIVVVYAFLANRVATIIISCALPVSLIATFIVLSALGFSINILTLLGLVLAIGMVVDDTIIVLENIHRRMEKGETAIEAAWKGSRQVGFAVVATTVVLVSIFLPISLIEGYLGRMFAEFALTIASAVMFSSLVALTLTPALCSRFLSVKKAGEGNKSKLIASIDTMYNKINTAYISSLNKLIDNPKKIYKPFLFSLFAIAFFFWFLNKEFVPFEDRGFIFSLIVAPEGSSYEYTTKHAQQIEERLLPLVEDKQLQRVVIRVPGSFVGNEFNTGIGFLSLTPHSSGRQSIGKILGSIYQKTGDISGATFIAFPLRPFATSITSPGLEYVMQGPSYEGLLKYRDIMMEEMRKNKGLNQLQSDYKETKPQLKIVIKKDRASEFGISYAAIGDTIQNLLIARKTTTYTDKGFEYDVVLESEKEFKNTPEAILNFHVRSPRTNQLIPLSNLIEINEFADAGKLNRFNRLRSITITANLQEGYSIGEAVSYMEDISEKHLPLSYSHEYKGLADNYLSGSESIIFFFILSIVVIFFALASQFENFVFPTVIMSTVPLAVFGGMLGLFLFFYTLNIYTQFALIILIGLCAKNGILIVEFINQLIQSGKETKEAIIGACQIRLRPILMTNITALAGSLPLILSSGPGEETRRMIGVVIFIGLFIGTLFSLFIIPPAYLIATKLFPKYTKIGNPEVDKLN